MDTEDPRDRAECLAAYVECACCADWPRDEEGNEVDNATLTSEGEQRMSVDLYAFLDDPAVAADVADLNPGQVGHDFWLTRNGHGTGFWDRGLGATGNRLSDAARVYGEDYVENYVEWSDQ